MKHLSLNSLRSQLLLWISLPVLVVLLTVALTGVQGHGQAMHELVQSHAEGLAQAVALLIDARIDRQQDSLLSLSLVPDLHHTSLDEENVRSVLAALENEFTGGVALYTETGTIATTAFTQWQDQDAVATLVGDAVRTQAPVVKTVEQEGQWILLYAVPTSLPDDGPLRTLTAIVPMSSLALDELTQTVIGDEASSLMLMGAKDERFFQYSAGSELDDHPVFAQATVPTTGWQVTLRQPTGQWIPSVLRFGNMLLLVVVAAATLSVLSAYFGLQQIIQPLERLDRAVAGLGRGDFETVQKPVGGVQEIEELQLALTEMAQQVQRYQRQLQEYIGAITLGQEEERKRVARELHDETVQALIALNQQVEMAEHRMADDPTLAIERLRTLRPLIGETIAGIRRQIQNLRPPYLEDLGFISALEMLVQQTASQHGLVGDFEVIGHQEESLPPAVEISGYRIVQEALHNVANHAKASWVHVELVFEADAVLLRIEDDGVGFAGPSHPQQLAQAEHYGLLGMGERARLHGGTLHIDSTPGEGTTVTARLPVAAHLAESAQQTGRTF
ncbi:MAG: hypothetical protein KDD75_13655 [Caldilineaceae bacterium]|nr:hypothetical protein [Caldilineaceae bacterium]